MRKVIWWELCKKLKFDHMHTPESVPEIEMCKILWDFETQIDLLILPRRPDLMLMNKKMNLLFCWFCHPSENQRKHKKRKLLWPCQRKKKAVEHERDGDTNCSWCIWNDPQRLRKGSGRVWNQDESRPEWSWFILIVEICQNTEKSPGNLRRLADF